VELGYLSWWCLRPVGRVNIPYCYPSEFRRRVLDLVAGGRSVASIAADLGVSDQTIYTWRKQELIDTGIELGLTTIEAGELRAAKHVHRA
jgi:transposase